jgi:hypothetical protein
VSVLIHLAVSMRAHGRGGSLLGVPSKTEQWRESVMQPVLYALEPPFPALADLMQNRAAESPDRGWLDALRRAVDGVAGLTAVDGATVISDQYEVLAFGAKIVRRHGSPQVTEVIMTEPIEGARAEVIEPGQLGGTRHLSAAQFVRDQHDAVALVASQDGRFTVFAWSPCENMVDAAAKRRWAAGRKAKAAGTRLASFLSGPCAVIISFFSPIAEPWLRPVSYTECWIADV